MIVLSAFGVSFVNAGSGLRDEIVDSFAVKPGGTLTVDSDLANVRRDPEFRRILGEARALLQAKEPAL